MFFKKLMIFFIFILINSISCRNILLPSDDPENTPEKNFEIFWEEFDRYYSFFELKGIDWNAQYAEYRPKVTENTTGRELFEILSEMADIFQDGHVNIYSPYGIYHFNFWENFPENFYWDIIPANYLKSAVKYWNNVFVTGLLNGNIGYVHISTFAGNDQWKKDADSILEKFRDTDGMIIDVRHNGGGGTNYSQYLADRFADRKRLWGYIKWRNGPGHGDFSSEIPGYIKPSKKWQYLKPVIILTNRYCFSTTETFVLSMRALPSVTVVGDFTGGGSGNPIARELPNGWVYRLSRWIEMTPDKKPFEGTGLEPDIRANISEFDKLMRRDTILNVAIETLNSLVEN